MAEHLARIIGTEEDRVNCPFYWKIGACRHGDQCSRSHYKPSASQTLILRHMYQNPPVAVAVAEGQQVSDELLDEAADHFESFYEEVFEELANYGEIEDMVVCDNIGDHIIGNVYVKFADEEAAAKALQKLSGRFYSGKQIQAEYTPVTDFREARCRQFVDGQCRRGGYCNFMHIKHVPRALKRKLINKMFKDHPEYLNKRHYDYRRSRSRSRYRDYRDRGYDKRYNSSRDYDRDREYGAYHRDSDRYERRNGDIDRERDRNRERDRGSRGPYNEDRDRRGAASYRERNGGDTNSSRHVRQTSEERRAMIAKWNEERENAANAANNNHDDDDKHNEDTNTD